MSAIATATDLDEGVAGFTDGNLTVLVTVEWADVTSFAQDGGFRGEALRHAARPILQSKGQILGVLWKTCTTREREREEKQANKLKTVSTAASSERVDRN